MGPGDGSRPAATTTAAGSSTTSRATTRLVGARCSSAGTGRRRERTALGIVRGRDSWRSIRVSARSHVRGPGARSRTLDDLDPIGIWVPDEAEPVAALAHRVRLALGLDPLLLQARERRVEVVDAYGDVPVARAQLVRAPVVVEGQLEHRLLVAEREEVVRRLQLAVADDVEVAGEREPERLVEDAALPGIGDADHGVKKGGHGGDPIARLAGRALEHREFRLSSSGISSSAATGKSLDQASVRRSSTRWSFPPSERGTLPGALSATASEQPMLSRRQRSASRRSSRT